MLSENAVCRVTRLSLSLLTASVLSLAGCGGGGGGTDVVSAQAATLTDASAAAAASAATDASASSSASALLTSTSSATDTVSTTAAAGTTATTTLEVSTTSSVAAADVTEDNRVSADAVRTRTFGTTLRPFSADSPWNSRPVNPVLSDLKVPKSSYYPVVASGTLSTGVFVAASTDSAMVVKGPVGAAGIVNIDTYTKEASITIPRWPASTLPATGDDGHCEIYDPVSGVIHSFWQLKKVNGEWRASLYGWSKLNGRGFGDGAHYYQGARAAGVPASAGLIRKHEINDGDTMYRHALAMSMDYSGLANSPTYVFPATAADGDAAVTNTGAIPEGALVMLPSTFDVSKLATPKLQKVARTLMTYGAYVVDRNTGTPYAIYVENGSDFSLHPTGGWNAAAAADLETIRAAMRSVKSAASWVNGNGLPVTFSANLNALSMRGQWLLQSGAKLGEYDTWKQAIVFPASSTKVVQYNTSGTGFSKVAWAKPVAGKTYKLTARTTGGGQLRLSFNSCTKTLFDSGALSNGQSYQFVWPSNWCWNTLYAISGVNQASTVSAELVRVE